MDIRAPDDIKEFAKEDYLSGMKYKDLAEKYEVSINTVKSWVKRYEWSKEKKSSSKKGAHKNNKKGAPFNNKNAVGNNGGAPHGNKNAVGNSGGGAPEGNDNALVHGLFAEYLPKRTKDIIAKIQNRSPIDMLWDVITIKYSSIIASQEIMYVESKDEMIKELKKKKVFESENSSSSEEEWEFQFAWDRQATFFNAQSRAMAELRNYIKQYDEMCKSDLATEEQKLRIEKLKVEIDRAKEDNKATDQVVIVDDI